MANILITKEMVEEKISNAEHVGYMIGAEYLYNLGKDEKGAIIFPSMQSIFENFSYLNQDLCPGNVPQDGIVEVKVQLIKHIAAEECLNYLKYGESK